MSLDPLDYRTHAKDKILDKVTKDTNMYPINVSLNTILKESWEHY